MNASHLCYGSEDGFNIKLVSLMDENKRLRFDLPDFLERITVQY